MPFLSDTSASRTRLERDTNLHKLRSSRDKSLGYTRMSLLVGVPGVLKHLHNEIHLKNEIGMNFGSKFPPPLTCSGEKELS